ncbi:MAG TPA: serine protease [Thermoleophilaceae bacterium]
MSALRLGALACLALVAAAVAIVATRSSTPQHGPQSSPTVVTVLARSGTAAEEKATGFAVANERVVTVAHALSGSAVAEVLDQRGVVHRGSVVRRDARLDLALLSVPGLRAGEMQPAASTGRARVLVMRGSDVARLPADIRRHVAFHLVDRVAARTYDRPALELAARIDAGDSGAPVLAGGRVAGVVFGRSNIRDGTAYAVDAEALNRLVSPR